jgi:hypothetical protein
MRYDKDDRSKVDRWVEHVREMRNEYKLVVGKPEGKSPLGRSKCRWEDNIKIYSSEIGWEDVDWIHVSRDRDWW